MPADLVRLEVQKSGFDLDNEDAIAAVARRLNASAAAMSFGLDKHWSSASLAKIRVPKRKEPGCPGSFFGCELRCCELVLYSLRKQSK